MPHDLWWLLLVGCALAAGFVCGMQEGEQLERERQSRKRWDEARRERRERQLLADLTRQDHEAVDRLIREAGGR